MADRAEVHLRPHDLVRLQKEVAPGKGVDICASISRIHRVYVAEDSIYHESTKDRGGLWVRDPAVASGVAEDTHPTICCGNHNELWIWWHDDAAVRCARSQDFGASWEDNLELGIGPIGGAKFPRCCFTVEGLFLCVSEPVLGPEFGGVAGLSFWKMYPDGPDGLAFGPATETLPGIPVQLASVRGDHFNRKVLTYQIGPNTLHTRACDIRTWSPPFLVDTATRTFTTHQTILERAVYVYFNEAEQLMRSRTGGRLVGFGDEAAEPIGPAGLVVPQYMGVGADRHGWFWMVGRRENGTVAVWFSEDRGFSWVLI